MKSANFRDLSRLCTRTRPHEIFNSENTKTLIRSNTLMKYIDGILYCDDGIIPFTGVRAPNDNIVKEYYLNGLLHREDGPAVEYKDGHRCWFLDGQRHRTDGPACYTIVNAGDYSNQSWCVQGEKIDCDTQEEFEQLMRLKAFW